jgi:UDP-glucose 4-epimerase
MKKILITGADAYIDSCLFYILKSKFKIIGIDKKKSSNKKIFQCNILNNKKFEFKKNYFR